MQAGPAFHQPPDILFSIILPPKFGLHCSHGCAGNSGDWRHWRKKVKLSNISNRAQQTLSQGSLWDIFLPPLISTIRVSFYQASSSPISMRCICIYLLGNLPPYSLGNRWISRSITTLLYLTQNCTLVQVWVIKLMTIPWTRWVRVCSREILVFPKSQDKVPGRAGSFHIFSLSADCPAVPGKKNYRSPSRSQARSCRALHPVLCVNILPGQASESLNVTVVMTICCSAPTRQPLCDALRDLIL